MLSWTNVLNYIKSNLSLPSGFLELTDDNIQSYIKLTALPEFSSKLPDISRTAVLTQEDTFKVNGVSNKFYFFDAEECDIMNITNVYFSLSNSVWLTHPFRGPWTFSELQNFALDVFITKLFQKYTDLNLSVRFWQPNIIEILPTDTNIDNFIVEYERVHPDNLSTIPTACNLLFMDLCLAFTMIRLGNLRTMYSSTSTPFGEIPLNGEEMRSRGEELRQKVMDKLEEESLPPIFIDIE